mmetsp:Transcript_19437/g.25078  ORF Transcript_19437/g.25078 Transcript_19437/m.25078 type:complete len:247 (+) Transcript_19437:336-1076(+)
MQKPLAMISYAEVMWLNPHAFLLYIREWRNLRLVSAEFCALVDSHLKVASFKKEAPAQVVGRFLDRTPFLQAVHLDNMECVTDLMVFNIFKTCRLLKYIGLTYCQGISTNVLTFKPKSVIANIHGCWRLIQPGNQLSPISVVEVQLLALTSGSQVGVQHFFRFVRGGGMAKKMRKQIKEGLLFSELLQSNNSTLFTINKITFRLPSIARFIVHLSTPGKTSTYLWELIETPNNKMNWMCSQIIHLL